MREVDMICPHENCYQKYWRPIGHDFADGYCCKQCAQRYDEDIESFQLRNIDPPNLFRLALRNAVVSQKK